MSLCLGILDQEFLKRFEPKQEGVIREVIALEVQQTGILRTLSHVDTGLQSQRSQPTNIMKQLVD